jgi:hypothetical protein
MREPVTTTASSEASWAAAAPADKAIKASALAPVSNFLIFSAPSVLLVSTLIGAAP